MSQISEEEDALLARLLLNTDLVSEQNVEMVRELKETFREQGVKVSIVDLLIQSGFLSRSDLNSLREMVNEETGEGESIMPPRFEHPFLTQQDLAERALDEGIISEDTFEQVEAIRDLFDEHGVSKTGGEILVEQGFVEPYELDIDEEPAEEEGTMDIPSEDEVDLSSTNTSTSEGRASGDRESGGETLKRSSVISELDRFVIEELVERGRLERSQIPTIVEKARERQQGEGGASAVQDVLKDQGIIHPTKESEILSAAMDRRDEAQASRRQFSSVGPMTVTIVLVICVAGVFFLLFGSGDEGSVEKNGAVTNDEGTEETTTTAARDLSEAGEDDSSETQQPDRETEEEPEPAPLLTFQANVGALLGGNTCQCDILFDGQRVTSVSGTIDPEGQIKIEAFPRSDRDRYTPGAYLLDCEVTETPGQDLPLFPLVFQYALEERDPGDGFRYEALLGGDLWDFKLYSGFDAAQNEQGRKAYAMTLRKRLRAIREQWKKLKPLLARDEPENRQLSEAYGTLNEWCGRMVEKLNSRASKRSFYYPNIREVVRRRVRNLPKVAARVWITQLRNRDIDVPDRLLQAAGNVSGGSLATAESIANSIREQMNQLPGEGDSVNPFYGFEPLLKQELRKLAGIVQALWYIRNDEDLRRKQIERHKFISVSKYLYAQINLRSMLLDRTLLTNVFDESTASPVEGLPKQVQKYLRLVLVDLADARGVELPDDIADVEGSMDAVEEDLTNRFDRVGIEVPRE